MITPRMPLGGRIDRAIGRGLAILLGCVWSGLGLAFLAFSLTNPEGHAVLVALVGAFFLGSGIWHWTQRKPFSALLRDATVIG